MITLFIKNFVYCAVIFILICSAGLGLSLLVRLAADVMGPIPAIVTFVSVALISIFAGVATQSKTNLWEGKDY